MTKPFTQSLASSTVMVLIINKKQAEGEYSERQGKKISKGFRNTFSNANTIAKMIAVP